MKLLNKPERIVQQINLGGTLLSGRATLDTVKIECPREAQNTADVVWNRLKYGPLPDMPLGIKIDKIVFHEAKEDIVLYGVSPCSVTEIPEGRIVECHVDHFTITEI